MVRNARIKIPVNGQLRPYTDAEWVIFTPSAFPAGFQHVEYEHLRKTSSSTWEADEGKAFADYWKTFDRNPLTKAMEGYTIKLVATEELDELMNQHLGKEAEGKEERQHDDKDQAA